MSEEDKVAIAEEAQADDDEFVAEIEGNTTTTENESGTTTMMQDDAVSKTKAKYKKGLNRDCVIDVWKKGLQLIKEDNIQETRDQKSKRFVREKKLMDAIGKLIKNAELSNRKTRLDKEAEVEETPAWLAKCSNMSRFS